MALFLPVNGVWAGNGKEVAKVEVCADVIQQFVKIPDNAAPPILLRNAQAIAIVPGIIKGGFYRWRALRLGRGYVTSGGWVLVKTCLYHPGRGAALDFRLESSRSMRSWFSKADRVLNGWREGNLL